jgi:hypothetical protein
VAAQASDGAVATPAEAAAAFTSRPLPAPELRLVDSGPISAGTGSAQYIEPWLAVNPADTDNLIAAAMNVGDGPMSSSVWASHDAGRTWVRARDADGVGDFPDGDPMATFAPDGTAYFTTLADGFTVWRSNDGGASWKQAAQVPGGSYDRQWLTVDHTDGPFRGRVYSAGKIWVKVVGSITRDIMALSYSEDNGMTFDWPELVLPRPDEEVLHSVTDLLVAPDGALIVPFLSHFWNGPRAAGSGTLVGRGGKLVGRFSVLRSEDGGHSFSDPYEVAEVAGFGHARPELMNKGLGGGRLAVDRSGGRYHGRLYLTWPQAVGDTLQIFVAASADGGRTWQEPVRVNDGGPRSAHGNPAIAVNRDGVVAVTWNDRRDDPTDRCFRLYAAASTDGGASFGPDLRVGDVPTCPAGRWANGGDTQGLVGLADGDFVAAWINGVDDRLQVWWARLAVTRP